MQFNEVQFNNFRKDWKQAMKSLEDKYGVSMSTGTITYDSKEFRFKTTVKNVVRGGVAIDPKQEAITTWNANAPMYGLPKDMIGKRFVQSGKTYIIESWNSRSNKYKVNIKDQKGTSIKCTPSYVKNANIL